MGMTERQRRQMIQEGKNPDMIVRMADVCMEIIKKEGTTLSEAKAIIERMACIVEQSERYRPETLLRDIPLRS